MSYFEVGTIPFEGANSLNPLAFKHYNGKELVGDKTMEDHLKFAMSYWHTFTAMGSDPFGSPTMEREWDKTDDVLELAKNRVYASFEFMQKLGLKYFCFHDADILPDFGPYDEYCKALDEIVDVIEGEMKKTGIKLLWGTTNAFSNKAFVHGAGTSCNPEVFALAAAKVKKAMDITNRLGGLGYVFWGGREGYDTLLNTKMKFELDNLARLLTLARNYKKEIGFDGQLLIEPKPKEPTKHQYDFDAGTIIGFLKSYNLFDDFKLNLEVNHATLAGHTIQHECVVARENGILGSLDANYGDLMLGWDTDQFPTNVYDATFIMYEVLLNGGIPVGINFDAKVRRASFEDDDLFIAYIAGMDTFAKGLKVAYALLKDRVIEDFKDERYSGFEGELGQKILNNECTLGDYYEYTINSKGVVGNKSGRQEYLESVVNQYIYNTK